MIAFNLQKVTFMDSLTAINEGALYRCISLKTVNFGNNITSIGPKAFYQNSNISGTLTLSDSSFYCKYSIGFFHKV